MSNKSIGLKKRLSTVTLAAGVAAIGSSLIGCAELTARSKTQTPEVQTADYNNFRLPVEAVGAISEYLNGVDIDAKSLAIITEQAEVIIAKLSDGTIADECGDFREPEEAENRKITPINQSTEIINKEQRCTFNGEATNFNSLSVITIKGGDDPLCMSGGRIYYC